MLRISFYLFLVGTILTLFMNCADTRFQSIQEGSILASGVDEADSDSLEGSQPQPETDKDPSLLPPVSPSENNLEQTKLWNYNSTDEIFLNPERGFNSYAHLGSTSYDHRAQKNVSLGRLHVDLEPFRTSLISEAFLEKIKNSFKAARSSGIKLMIMHRPCLYIGCQDSPESWIYKHMDQLAPIYKSNVDVIHTFDVGWIGPWGEWHSSTEGHDNPESARRIIEYALTKMIPKDRMMSVREPYQKINMYNDPTPLTASEAYSGSFKARIYHANHCFLYDNIDRGTYDEWWKSKYPFLFPTVEAQKDYLAKETQFLPFTFETCEGNSPDHQRLHCATAIPEMERFHVTNGANDWPEANMQVWKSEGCYDEISRRLGYRFELKTAEFPTSIKSGSASMLKINLRNVGFASLFNPRPVYLVLDGPERYEFKTTIDPRWWQPKQDSTLSVTIKMPEGASPGQYTLALWLPDPYDSIKKDSRFSVRFANKGVWDSEKGYNILGDLQVDP